MTKRDSQATRRRILEQAAVLLNTRGYLSTSVTDVMEATGLKKGGIYHHFESLESLALEAFRYAVAHLRARVIEATQGPAPAKQRLSALISVFRNLPFDEQLRGGCPIANLAIEADHANPRLRSAAQEAMEQLVARCAQVIQEGVAQGELAPGDPRARALHIIAALEGGLMLSNLYRDYAPLAGVADALEKQVGAGLA